MLNFNKKIKQLVLVLLDIFMVGGALFLALHLRFEGHVPPQFFENMERLFLPFVVIHLTIFLFFGLYRRLWRYASVDELVLITLAVFLGSAGSYAYSYFSELMLPRSVYMIFFFLLLLLLGGSRLSLRLLADYLRGRGSKGGHKRVLIIGAGDAGVLVAGELKKNQPRLNTSVVGFIDDNPNKRGQIINGIPVLGAREELPAVVEDKNIDEVIIAIPSAPYSQLRRIIDICRELPVKLSTVPGIYEILEGNINFTQLKEVEIEDLLRRPPVKVDIKEIAGYLAGRTVLVTGAGGSIGSELCRQVAMLGPSRLLMLDHDENGIFYVNQEMRKRYPQLSIVPLVRDIQDRPSLQKVMELFQPQVIFHAAAYKHVPLMELNAEEAVKNNVLGSKNLIDLAESCGVQKLVVVSTDKAVNPSSVMGSTKRATEIYMQYRARHNGRCTYCAVRFGNVLGSRGSVVTLFKEQIQKGGPVEVTHPDMTRFFMTIPEAVQLVIQAGALGGNGEIFILDMGEPVKIVELARDMIVLSGLQPGRDIEIKYTGIRPGEKLFEDLFSDRESFKVTRHERIFVAPDTFSSEEEIRDELRKLGGRLDEDLEMLLGLREMPENILRLKKQKQ